MRSMAYVSAELELLADLLGELYESVRLAVLELVGAGAGPALGRNPKGDEQKPFDVAADEAVRRTVERAVSEGRIGPMVIASEESGDRLVGHGPPKYRLVVDPVDGSDNWWRGLPVAAFSAAVLPADSPLDCQSVLAGLVGDLREGDPWMGLHGRGVSVGISRRCEPPRRPWSALHASPGSGRPARLRVSGARSVAEAFISCDLAHWRPSAGMVELIGRARAVRSYGCASIAIALVAAGKLDAHVDVRARLTPENYLAAGMLVRESGGCLLDEHAEPLEPAASLTEPKSIIAAASVELAKEIAHVLGQRNG